MDKSWIVSLLCQLSYHDIKNIQCSDNLVGIRRQYREVSAEQCKVLSVSLCIFPLRSLCNIFHIQCKYFNNKILLWKKNESVGRWPLSVAWQSVSALPSPLYDNNIPQWIRSDQLVLYRLCLPPCLGWNHCIPTRSPQYQPTDRHWNLSWLSTPDVYEYHHS